MSDERVEDVLADMQSVNDVRVSIEFPTRIHAALARERAEVYVCFDCGGRMIPSQVAGIMKIIKVLNSQCSHGAHYTALGTVVTEQWSGTEWDGCSCSIAAALRRAVGQKEGE